MKIYVASSWRNDRQPEVVKAIEAAGHEVYDFRNPSMGPGKRGKGFHWSEIDPQWKAWTPHKFRMALLHRVAIDGFTSDLTGMKWADVFVLVMPCGRSAHLELGWAIGAGKPSFILLSDGEPELMYGLADRLCLNIDELLLRIDAEVMVVEGSEIGKTKNFVAIDGRCCSCKDKAGLEETPCPERDDRVHCNHWWEGAADAEERSHAAE